MILPRVNVRRQAAWYKDGEPPDMSPVDAQARPPDLAQTSLCLGKLYAVEVACTLALSFEST